MSVVQGRTLDTREAVAVAVDAQGRLVLSGTINATIAGFATETTLAAINGKLPALVGGAIPIVGTISTAGLATETTLAAVVAGVADLSTDLGSPIAHADNLAPGNQLGFQQFGYLFDGTTWDRARGGIVGVQVTPTGFQNGLPYGRYLDTPPTLVTGSFQHLLLDASGNLKVALSGASALGNLAIPSDVLDPTEGLETTSFTMVYDAVNDRWERARSSTFNPSNLVGHQNILPIGRYIASPPTLTDGQNQGLTLTADGSLRVSSQGVTIPVADDTVAANTGTVISFLKAFDGTNWDRLRSGFLSAVSSAIGFLNTIPMAQYVSALPTLTANNVRSLLLDINGRLLTRPYRPESYIVTIETVTSTFAALSRIPANAKSVAIRARNANIAFDIAIGVAPTDTVKYVTVPAGSQYYLEDVNLLAQTFYARSNALTPVSNVVVSGTTTNGASSVTISYPDTVVPGMFIGGTNIPSNAMIATKGTTTISMQDATTFAPAVATGSGTQNLTAFGLVLEVEYTI